jgi:hypothetical protein
MSRTLLSVPAHCLAAVLCLLALTVPARADLRFTQPVLQLGEVRAGVPLAHRFAFVNAGPAPVAIMQVRGSCGCLKPGVLPGDGPLPRVYPPGAEGAVLVEVNTLGQAQGPHTWRIEVTYRQGEQVVEMPLLLAARVVAEVTVQPAALTVVTGSAIGHDILLTDLRTDPLSIAGVQTSSPQLRTRVVEEFRDGMGHLVRRINLEVGEDYPEGRHDEVLNILTDDPTYKDLRVPVTIYKRSRQRLSAAPSPVTLFAPSGQPVPSRIVLIRDVENEPVAVERVTADDPAVVCQWAQGPGNGATVKIYVDRSKVTGQALRSTVQVHVSRPVQETVTIPVSCTLH